MDARSMWLWGSLMLASADALAQVQWTRAWAEPSQAPLHCEHKGFIKDRQTRADITARHPGIVGNINRITELMQGMRRDGYQGDDNSVQIVLRYRLVYDSPVRFDAKAGNAGMVSGVFRTEGGGFKVYYNHEDAVKHLSPAQATALRRLLEEWPRRRAAEVEALRAWHGQQHAWEDWERKQWHHTSDGTFRRPLKQAATYQYCGRHYPVTFKASWRSIGAPKKSKK